MSVVEKWTCSRFKTGFPLGIYASGKQPWGYKSYHLSDCYQLYKKLEAVQLLHIWFYKTDDGYSCNHAEWVVHILSWHWYHGNFFGSKLIKKLLQNTCFMKDGWISGNFDTKYMTVIPIEQILHSFEDQNLPICFTPNRSIFALHS